ncbi:uncharacterized protein LOC104904161 [Beta vulgaris subsp. vulgaris]|uniref:uncharacterized protein LOC104904161 n=1 Tax=Beta vulgaris subsp. vulgaris TaxID=3555 RepID=UPI00053FB600|nr:uncharacterized protein LOC104904161 [Beta vulgaris subsp. vulgaris]
MNSFNLNFSRSSSSSSSSSDERRSSRAIIDQEIDDFLTNIVQPLAPTLISNVTLIPRNRRAKVTDDNEEGHSQPNRGKKEGHRRLFNDYFADQPVYPARLFRRRFRMQRHVFLRIMESVVAIDVWFTQKRDATGQLSLSPLQKCTAAIRMLAYGVAADSLDEYVRISESTTRISLMKFTKGVITKFGTEYLRRPTPDDLARLLRFGEESGFSGMVGSIDCMHWEWKNCLTAWKGQYQGRAGVATLVLEAVDADRDLWTWHSFFRIPGSCNDLHVLHQSPVFRDVLEGRAPPVQFTVNGNQYDKGYYLTNGIYLNWATFIQSVTCPQTLKDKLFAQHQEGARKDIERAFGVLQSQFAIVRRPSLAWDEEILNDIMLSCIMIMHNMIVEDERDTYAYYADTTEFTTNTSNNGDEFEYYHDRIVDINQYMANRDAIEDQHVHHSLKRDLVANIRHKFGGNAN